MSPVRHIVLLRTAPQASAEEVRGALAALADLRRHVPGIVSFAAGANTSPEGLARGYTHAFTADFASAADRDGYLAHPAHRAAAERLLGVLDGGVEGLAVIDFNLG